MFKINNSMSALVILSLLFSFFTALIDPPAALASNETPVYSGGFPEGTKTYTFGENVNVRKDAKIADGNVIDKLPAGTEVTVKSAGADLTIEGLAQKWYGVEYKKDDAKKSGYIWGGFLALAYSPLNSDGGKPALTGLKKYSKKDGLTAELRIVSANKIVSSAAFKPQNQDDGTGAAYSYSLYSNDFGEKMGFTQFEKLIFVKCLYEACGYTNGTNWFGLTKDDKVYFIAAETTNSEAGVYQARTFITFPSDKGGIRDGVVLTDESAEFDEAKKDYVVKSSKDEKLEWKNGAFVKVK